MTYCDNVHYWNHDLKEVAHEVDFISIHLYPVWEGKNVPEAIDQTIDGYEYVKNLYPNKQVIITETVGQRNLTTDRFIQMLLMSIIKKFLIQSLISGQKNIKLHVFSLKLLMKLGRVQMIH